SVRKLCIAVVKCQCRGAEGKETEERNPSHLNTPYLKAARVIFNTFLDTRIATHWVRAHENHPGRTHWRFSSSGNLGPQGCSCLSWHRVLRTHQCLSHANPRMESTVAPPIKPKSARSICSSTWMEVAD